MTDHTSFSRRLRPYETAADDGLYGDPFPKEIAAAQAAPSVVMCPVCGIAIHGEAQQRGFCSDHMNTDTPKVVAIESAQRDYSTLRAAAVAWRMDAKKWHAQFCEAEAALAESNAKYEAAATVTGNMMSEYAEMRDALAETRKAGFKLTAALCALPEDDKEKISRPRVMELVVAWRAALDAAMKEQKK